MAFGRERPINWRTFLICVIISLGQFASAYSQIIIGTTIGKRDFMETMKLWDSKGKPTHDFQQNIGVVVGLFQAGAVVGTLLTATIMDRWGRRVGFICSSIVALIGFAGLTGSVNIQMFVVFRFIMGVGGWGYAAVSVLYISEVAPPEYRGFFAGLNGVMIGLGCTIASYVGMGFFFAHNSEVQWRTPLGIGMLFPLLLLCASPWIPESPRYLLLKERREEAWKIVAKLHDVPTDPEQVFAQEEFFQMTKQAELDRTLDMSWLGLFKNPAYRKRIFVACTLMFFAQSTAVTVINNYGTILYKTLGFSPADQQILQGNRDTIALIGNLAGSMLVDRVGRKKIILFGFTGCLICLVMEAAMVACYAGTTNKNGLNAGVAFLYIYLLFYSSGVDVGGFVFIGEMFPNHIRAKGSALALATLNATTAIYLGTAPLALAKIGWKFFMIFAALTTCGIIWVCFVVPETKGVPLEEMGALFGHADEVVVYLNEVHLDPVTRKPVVVDEDKAFEGGAGKSHHLEVKSTATEV